MTYILVVKGTIGIVLKLVDLKTEPATGSHINVSGVVVMKYGKFGSLSLPENISKIIPVELDLSNILDSDQVYATFPPDCALLLNLFGRAFLTPALANEFGMDCPRSLPLYKVVVTSSIAKNMII